MLSVRDFWRRHRSKILYTTGVLGSAYLFYKLYETHKRRLHELERELQIERDNDEFIHAQLQAHFESIQKIVDTMTLPHAMHNFADKIAVELDLSHITERLIKGKVQPGILTSLEKLELWDKLKILSFTRMLSSLWSMTILSLYIRVQVNILGRHLYLDAARHLGGSIPIEENDLIHSQDQKTFLASSDFLANCGLPVFISDIQTSAEAILQGKQLREIYNNTELHEIMMQILDMFLSIGSPNHWVDYLMPPSQFETHLKSSSDFNKFEQIMAETRMVLLSEEFSDVAEVSLKIVMGALMEDTESIFEGDLSPGIPLAKLLPRIAQMGPVLLEETHQKRYIQIIRSVPEVECFFTRLYAGVD